MARCKALPTGSSCQEHLLSLVMVHTNQTHIMGGRVAHNLGKAEPWDSNADERVELCHAATASVAPAV